MNFSVKTKRERVDGLARRLRQSLAIPKLSCCALTTHLWALVATDGAPGEIHIPWLVLIVTSGRCSLGGDHESYIPYFSSLQLHFRFQICHALCASCALSALCLALPSSSDSQNCSAPALAWKPVTPPDLLRVTGFEVATQLADLTSFDSTDMLSAVCCRRCTGADVSQADDAVTESKVSTAQSQSRESKF